MRVNGQFICKCKQSCQLSTFANDGPPCDCVVALVLAGGLVVFPAKFLIGLCCETHDTRGDA